MIWGRGDPVRRISLVQDALCRVRGSTQSRPLSIQILSHTLRVAKSVSSRNLDGTKSVYSQNMETQQTWGVNTRTRIVKERISQIGGSGKKETEVIPLWELTEPATSSFVHYHHHATRSILDSRAFRRSSSVRYWATTKLGLQALK